MYSHYIKRVFDFIFALYLMLPVTLMVVVCALLVKLEDGGPAFYAEKRLGRYGRTFKTYILRSTCNLDDNPCLTRVGKFIVKSGIDELPQIYNILRGDMSFIGPRPDLSDYSRHFEINELRKLQVLPGISGYNQDYCINSTEWEQRLQNDLYYVDNISLCLDLKILFRIIEQDVFQKGRYAASNTKSEVDEIKSN